MERYELVEGNAAKFWEASVAGATLTVRFRRIGTQGQSKDKTFSDAAAALKEKDKLVREKTAKGYARAGDGAVEEAASGAAPAGLKAPEAVKTAKPAGKAPAMATTEVEPTSQAQSQDAAPVALEPEEAGPAVAPSRAVFDGTPLPTRLRPGCHLSVEPWSVGTERLVVPDLDDPDGPGAPLLPIPARAERDAIEETEALLAGALHAGRRAFAPPAASSGPRLVARLRQSGHAATAARLSAFLASREETAAIFAQAALWVAMMREDAGPLAAAA